MKGEGKYFKRVNDPSYDISLGPYGMDVSSDELKDSVESERKLNTRDAKEVLKKCDDTITLAIGQLKNRIAVLSEEMTEKNKITKLNKISDSNSYIEKFQ